MQRERSLFNGREREEEEGRKGEKKGRKRGRMESGAKRTSGDGGAAGAF